MRKTAFVVGAFIAFASPAGAQRASSYADPVKAFIVADQPTIVIRNARLWDGTGNAAVDGQDMVVTDGRIAAIGPSLATPVGAKIIDARGHTLMPGLVMMHEHLMSATEDDRTACYSSPYQPQILLAYGTTTARTAGGFDMEGDLYSKKLISEGKRAGPDLDVTLYIEGPESILMLPKIADAASARREVGYWNDRGATSIKLFFNSTPDIAKAAIDEARKRGMTVAAHLCATLTATAAQAGIDTLEHSLLAAYDIVPGVKEGACPMMERQPQMIKRMASLDPNGPEVGAVLATLLKNGVAIDPTLAARESHLCSPSEIPADRERALLAKFDRGNGMFCFGGINDEIDRKSYDFQAVTAVRYHRLGGMLVMGTDNGLVAGAMGPRELELVVAAGLTPTEALVAATRNGAIKLKRDKDIGTLEVGKRADFLLVDGKPDVEISDIRKLTHVARDGIVYDPEKLYQDAKGKLR